MNRLNKVTINRPDLDVIVETKSTISTHVHDEPSFPTQRNRLGFQAERARQPITTNPQAHRGVWFVTERRYSPDVIPARPPGVEAEITKWGDFWKGIRTAARDIGSMVAGFTKSLGLHDIVGGLLSGDFSRIRNGCKTFGVALWQSTGIGALCSSIACACKGDWLGALGHFGQFALSVGGWVLGGGLGALAVHAGCRAFFGALVKRACKEFVDNVGVTLGKEIGEKVFSRIGKDLLQKNAHEMAERGAAECAKKLFGKSIDKLSDSTLSAEAREALLKRMAQKLEPAELAKHMKEEAKKVTEDLLRENGLVDLVENKVHDLLKNGIHKKSVDELAKDIATAGIAKGDDALRMAKGVKRTVARGGYYTDEALENLLVESISKPIKERLQSEVEDAFKLHMKRVIAGEAGDNSAKALSEVVKYQARSQAQKSGKQFDEVFKELTDDYVEAAWKGAKEGMDEAVEKLVREGVRRAIRRFRGDVDAPYRNAVSEEKKKKEAPRKSPEYVRVKGAEDKVKPSDEKARGDDGLLLRERRYRVEVREQGGTRTRVRLMQVGGADAPWREVGVEEDRIK